MIDPNDGFPVPLPLDAPLQGTFSFTVTQTSTACTPRVGHSISTAPGEIRAAGPFGAGYGQFVTAYLSGAAPDITQINVAALGEHNGPLGIIGYCFGARYRAWRPGSYRVQLVLIGNAPPYIAKDTVVYVE